MNPDELSDLLRATPDEPQLPGDPVAAVHRRIRVAALRRRGATAGALAVALAVVAGGVALAVPGDHDRGSNRIQVAHPSSTAQPTPPATAAPSAARTPAHTTAPNLLAIPGAVAKLGLPFSWSTTVVGNTVLVSGRWAGSDQVAPAADVGTDNYSTLLQRGSGVLGADAIVLTGTGQEVPAGTAPQENDFREGFVESNGGIPRCTGPAVQQERDLAPLTLTFARPGTYLLRMHSITCAGQRTDDVRITVTSTTPAIHESLVATATDIRAGDTIGLTSSVTSPFGQPGQSVEVIGQDGSRQVLDSPRPGCTSGQSTSTTTNDLGYTFPRPGRYVVLLRAGCNTENTPLDISYAEASTYGPQESAAVVIITVTASTAVVP